VVALQQTIATMTSIDTVIPEWPIY
jgi:hypothetical protein